MERIRMQHAIVKLAFFLTTVLSVGLLLAALGFVLSVG
jgi:hypothetical protein